MYISKYINSNIDSIILTSNLTQITAKIWRYWAILLDVAPNKKSRETWFGKLKIITREEKE